MQVADFWSSYPDTFYHELLYVIDFKNGISRVHLARLSEVATTFLLNKEIYTSACLLKFLGEQDTYSGLYQIINHLEFHGDIKNEIIPIIIYFLTTSDRISVDLLADMFTDSGIENLTALELANTVYFHGIEIPEGEMLEALRVGSELNESEETKDIARIFHLEEIASILQNKNSDCIIYDNYILHMNIAAYLFPSVEIVIVSNINETAYMIEDHERLVLGFSCILLNVMSLCMHSSPLLYHFIIGKTNLTERSCLSLGSYIRLNFKEFIDFMKINKQSISVGSYIPDNKLIKTSLESIFEEHQVRNYFPLFLDISKQD